jgi:tetratricopeptide (TPR) repeat protein
MGSLGRCELWGPEIQNQPLTIIFDQPAPEAELEFRIYVEGFRAGSLAFQGVYLRKTVPFNEILRLEAQSEFDRLQCAVSQSALSKPHQRVLHLGLVELTLEPGALKVKLTSARARRLRRLGDAARDRRDWPCAASFYRQALDRDATNAAIWLQYGHALKESRLFAEAESAYYSALSRCSISLIPEIYLQLGHLSNIQARYTVAREHYCRAIASCAGARNALEQIWIGDSVRSAILPRSSTASEG